MQIHSDCYQRVHIHSLLSEGHGAQYRNASFPAFNVMCCGFQEAEDADEAALKAAEAEGKDAFEELKLMASSKGLPPPPPPSTPEADYKRLLIDAALGLPVAGRVPTWEEGRPKVLPVGKADKSHGFVDYDRCALHILPAVNILPAVLLSAILSGFYAIGCEDGVQDWFECLDLVLWKERASPRWVFRHLLLWLNVVPFW